MEAVGPCITDQVLTYVRDKWDSATWDGHFMRLGLEPAQKARYDPNGNNDVLKWALSKEAGGRCWFQGGSCRSRGLLLRDVQIDHLIPQKCSASILREALEQSPYQRTFFDVHDPGNLALICGPCNQERSRKVIHTPATESRFIDSAESRGSVIDRVRKWHRNASLDDAVLKALRGADIKDDDTWEILANTFAELLQSRALSLSEEHGWETEVESQDYAFKLTLSDDAWASIAEDMRTEERIQEIREERYSREN